jgi:hypothetical protein
VRSNDLRDFTSQVEVLCAGFNVPPTEQRVEALWRGLQAMDLMVFTRVVECALAGGTERLVIEKMPTSPQLWLLSRSMKSRAPVREQPSQPERTGDRFQIITSKMLWLFMWRKGPFEPQALRSLLDAKEQLEIDYRMIAEEEVITDEEYGTAVYRKFASIVGCTDIKLEKAAA